MITLPSQVLASRPPIPRPTAATWLRAVRPRQWAKNAIVAVPAVATQSLSPASGVHLLLAFVFVTTAAGGTYLVNDVIDIDADARHPVKRHRPVAAGLISRRAARRVGVGLLVAGPALAASMLSIGSGAALLGYAALIVAYSVRLKRVPYLDVAILASGFALRVEIGACAIGRTAGLSLLVAVFAIALLVAVGKRRAELLAFGPRAAQIRPALAGYRLSVTEIVTDLAGLIAGAATLIWLGRTSVYVHEREALTLVALVMGVGVVRLLRLAHRGALSAPEGILADRVLLGAAFAAVVSVIGSVVAAPHF